MQAVVISIGDELVLGQTVDTNAAWLSSQLASYGVSTKWQLTVADDREEIQDAITEAAHDAELVIVTGGLGPTEDDLTRFALADALECELVLFENALDHLTSWFEQRGRKMAEANRVQAMLPGKSRMISNTVGTAPGIEASIGDHQIFVFPGVPDEMRVMFKRSIVPLLRDERNATSKRVILARKVNTFGEGESRVAELLGSLADRDRNPLVGTTVSDGIVAVRIRSESTDTEEAEEALNATTRAVEDALGELVFGWDGTTLAEATGQMLKTQCETVATAESCTGGLVGKMLTDTSGSSDYYQGGWVTYSNEMKCEALGVEIGMIEKHGAVSEEVAMAMAEGARTKSGAAFALSLTGIAGPAGGTEEKPVGTVWIGLSESGYSPTAARHVFGGNREMVRLRASLTALDMLRVRLLAKTEVI